VGRAGQVLTALSYQGVLARGFALVRDAAGRPLRTAASISAGLALDIEFSDGHVGAVATSGGASAPLEPAKARTPRASGAKGQGSLFDP